MTSTASVIGVDLAWSAKNGTGLAAGTVTENRVEVTCTTIAQSLPDIVEFISDHGRGEATIVAIDAPTVVPHDDRMRACELALHKDAEIRKANAAPYPGTRRLLGACNEGTPRGEELVSKLKTALAFDEVGCPPPLRAGRVAIEVFPAAAIARLFRLGRPLTYKKKRGRSWQHCQAGLVEYLACLRKLNGPQLVVRVDLRVGAEKGRAFKDLEDQIDAVLCAYVGALAWLGRVDVVGSLTDGYIVLPQRGN